MARNAQRQTEIRIKEALFGSYSGSEFLPELFEGNHVMMGMKVDNFTFAAVCSTLLTGVIIALEYGITPSNVRLGLSQYFLLLGYAAFPMMSFITSTLFGSFGLGNQGSSRFGIVVRKIFGNTSFGMHVRTNNNRFHASTIAKVFTLIFFNPFIYASIISAAMISGIRVVFNVPRHVTHCIKFNQRLQANWVNCWKPERVMSRAISSQARSTLLEGSETTGAV